MGENKGEHDGDARPGEASTAIDRGDRRRFLLKAGAAGAAAWVAPVVVSAPAFAATSAPPTSEPPPVAQCLTCNAGIGQIVNPSFESPSSGWTMTGGVLFPFLYANLGIHVVGFPSGSEAEFGSNCLLLIELDAPDPTPVPPGRAEQTIAIDPSCAGLPFELSFWSAEAQPDGSNVPVHGVQFTDGTNAVGPAFTISPPPLFQGPDAVIVHRTVTGTVPDGATAAVISFFGSDSVVDNVTFTVCPPVGP
jgi:hypothetical protein